MITPDFSTIQLRLQQSEGKTTVFDPVRKKWYILTPEEHVRQYILAYLLSTMRYPAALIAVEKKILVGTMPKRFDIIIYSPDHKPWMLVECKAPEVEVTEKTLLQLLNYQSVVQCRYWLLTNGRQNYCADAADVSQIKWLTSFPVYDI